MFINTIKIDLYSASKKQTNKQTPRQGSKQADVWTHVLQTVFRYGCRMEFVSSFSYRSIYRTHQFQFLSVAGLHTQHISSSSFLLPVYIPSTSVPVPFCCRSTYPAHQFQFLSVAGLHTQHINFPSLTALPHSYAKRYAPSTHSE